MSYEKFFSIPVLENCGSLLCIQPHPDDNEIGAGATIYKMSENGCHINFLTVTDGGIGCSNPTVKPEQLKTIRRHEQIEAGKLLGVEQHIFLDYHDAGNYSVDELSYSLLHHIRKNKPEMIMAPDPWLPYEAHPDHLKTGMAAARAVLLSEYPYYPYDNGRVYDTWAVNAVVFYNTAYPNTYVDVGNVWGEKTTALSFHKSQFSKEKLDMVICYLTEYGRKMAKNTGTDIAEAFKVLSPLHIHCFTDSINI
jgi:LmbE family N-acetylglucosaminyl deacetylase